MNNFEIIIGIENHVELKTKTKLFSPGLAEFGNEPNTSVNERDIAYPGTLPLLNKKCVELAILAANGLNMKIDSNMRFDRKNYYYSDLPKGYQITQQFHPIGSEGYIDINVNGTKKRIDIERLHIEEDTAKQIHSNITKIDYNRSGVGLIEIVTKPVMRSADEAAEYVSKLREILLFLGVSDVKMNEGSLRCDVNVSVRPLGYDGYGTRVEIKNLNSINNVKKSIDFEVARQIKLLLNNKVVKQQTLRFNEQTQETYPIREKGDSLDYKYFREPNIPVIKLDNDWIKNIISNSPELPETKREKYLSHFKLTLDEINYIMQDIDFVIFFEKCMKLNCDPKKIANILINDIKDLINKTNINIKYMKLSSEDLKELLELQSKGIISSKHLKSIIQIKFNSDDSIDAIIKKHDFKVISNTDDIETLLIPIFKEQNDFIIKEYNDRPQRVEKTIMGLLMKETNGNVSPEIGMEVIIKLIKKII